MAEKERKSKMFTGFKPNPEGIKAYNEVVEECKREYADQPSFASHFKTISGLDDVFTPYKDWIEDTKRYPELGFVPDNEELDFSRFFICSNPNAHYLIGRLTDYNECKRTIGLPYGVSDNATQIIEFVEIPDNCIVLITPVFKDLNEPCGGWRWRKWGPYYGVKNPKHEYLNDEEDIEYAYCFSVVKVKPKTTFISVSCKEEAAKFMHKNGYLDTTPALKYIADKIFIKDGIYYKVFEEGSDEIVLEILANDEIKNDQNLIL